MRHYFIDLNINEDQDNVAWLNLILNSNKYRTYFHFLNFILPQINMINKFFQRQDIIIHKIHRVLTRFSKNVASLFLNRAFVMQTSVSNINVQDQADFIGLENINLGPEANELIGQLDVEDQAEIRGNVYNYLKELLDQFKIRFENFQNNYYQGLEIFDPQNALSVQFHEQN